MNNEILSFRLALAITAQLVSSGIKVVVASPGYRNSPLLLAAHLEEDLEVVSGVDERGAAFLALGLAKAGTPSALLCTSGTAIANYFPAVMEAYHSHVPLLVITADRPVELVGTGANQCTDQAKVFGGHVRHAIEISCADSSFDFENHARYAVGKGVGLSQNPAPGPVHLNVRFREPFLPDAATAEKVKAERKEPALQWKFLPSASGPSKEQWEAVEAVLETATKPLVVLGAGDFSDALLAAVFSVSEKTGCPILAENASGLPFRSGRYAGYISRHVESTLSAIAKGEIEPPDLLIRIGAPLTGKGLGSLLKSSKIPQLLFDQWEESREPHLHPSICVQGGTEGWMAAILRSNVRIRNSEWRDAIFSHAEKFESQISSHLSSGPLTEWVFHHEVESKISEGSALFLGNSMPIRDFNQTFPASRKSLRIFTNRGLSGIDGLIATATGVALARGGETHAILGDLSTLHDLPSLALASTNREKLRLTFWIMNNGGGEIFKIVQTARTAGKQEWFTTPQTFDVAAIAKAFQIPFARISSREQWSELSASACSGVGVRIIEIMADAESNLRVRQSLGQKG